MHEHIEMVLGGGGEFTEPELRSELAARIGVSYSRGTVYSALQRGRTGDQDRGQGEAVAKDHDVTDDARGEEASGARGDEAAPAATGAAPTAVNPTTCDLPGLSWM